MDSLHWGRVICGHHVCMKIWTPFVDEVLHMEQKIHDVQDCFPVAVAKDGIMAYW